MKKIMFNDKYGLTRAVIDGRKTQTRRVIKGLPSNTEGVELTVSIISHREYDEQKRMLAVHTTDCLGKTLNIPYQVGEDVAVAMCYGNCGTWFFPVAEYGHMAGYTNKMFVRAEDMPYRIKITNIRVERLQDISEEDCLREGIKRKNERYCVENYKGVCFYTNNPKLAFRCLIDKTCGKGTWDSNPWVFVYDFELIK